jgi:hypothetical protein
VLVSVEALTEIFCAISEDILSKDERRNSRITFTISFPSS